MIDIANYDSIDLAWSWDGDLAVDELGDIKDTSDNYLQAIANAIQSVVKSESFDWEKDPFLGANLSEFQGEPNNRKIGKDIEERIKISLISQRIVQSGDVAVRVVPVHANEVLISIIVSAEPSSKNRLVPGEPLQLSLIYNSLENSIFFLLQDNIERAAR